MQMQSPDLQAFHVADSVGRIIKNMHFSKTCIAALSLARLGLSAQHGLIVGNFVQKSLYSVLFDDETFELELVANTTVPAPSSWLSWNHDKKTLYGTNYTYINDQQALDIPPTYMSFAVSNLTSIVHCKTLQGNDRCNGSAIYIEALKVAPYTVYGFDYWGTPGCGVVMSVDSRGSLAETVQDFEYWPESGVHGSAFNSENAILYAADTLGNAIWTQPIDKESGRLGGPIDIAIGPKSHDGPRHVILHTSGNALYAVMEGSNEMAWYGISKDTQKLELRGMYDLLPQELLGSENHWANEVVVSPSGAYIWATTRGRNADSNGYIAVFSADKVTGEILKRNFLRPTTTSGGVANVVIPSELDDHIVALTDNEIGFLEIWRLADDAMSAGPVSRIVLSDQGNARYASGCCAGAVWVD